MPSCGVACFVRAHGPGSLSPVVSSSILTVSFSSREHAASSQGSLLEVPLSLVLFMFRVFGPQLLPPLPANRHTSHCLLKGPCMISHPLMCGMLLHTLCPRMPYIESYSCCFSQTCFL